MNKIFMSLVAGCLWAMSAQAIDWNMATNVAKGCSVTVSSKDGEASRITDGDMGTRWQAVASGENADWVVVDLGQSRQVMDITILQEASYAPTYNVYLLAENPVSEEGVLDVEGVAPNHNGSTSVEDGYREDIHFNEAVEGRYLVFLTTSKSGNAIAYGTSIFEVMMGEYIADYNEVKSIAINNLTLINGDTAECVVSAYTAAGNKVETLAGVENLSLTLSDPEAAEITGGENGVYTIRAQKIGMYTLTATATINGETVTATATLNIQFSWDTVQNAALNKNAYASHNTGEAGLSVDGDMSTRWQVGAEILTGTWYYVDLGDFYTISAIAPTWETAYASHYKYYTATELGADNDPLWVELAEINKTIDGANMYTDTYVLPAPVEARYVKLECLESRVWGMSFYEFRVAGEAAGELKATEIALSAERMVLMTGESVQISALVKDNYNNQMDATPTLRIAEGEGMLESNRFTATAKGKVTIEAVYENLEAVLELNVAIDANDKINLSDATATADDKTSDSNPASNAIDGNAGTLWVAGEGEPVGEAEHWLQVNLAYAYDLDGITLSWEGASPADYKVFAGSDENNLTEVYSVTGMPGMRNYTDVIAAGVKDARVIRVVTTKNATGYGIKIFELEAYGSLAAGQGYTRSVTESNYGTLCLPFASTQVENAKVYSVQGLLNNTTLVLNPVETLEAGHPYIFLATATGQLKVTYEAGSGVWTPVAENGLYGTLTRIAGVSGENNELTGKYMLDAKDNTWKQAGTGCSLGANRAYIVKDDLPALTEAEVESTAVLQSIFIADDETGISDAVAADAVVDVYTVSGVRVRSSVKGAQALRGLPRGLYIVNGKRIVVE